ncbi:MAG: hypothetical protein ACT4NY_25030 [Pseudonocardiales bacterium]
MTISLVGARSASSVNSPLAVLVGAEEQAYRQVTLGPEIFAHSSHRYILRPRRQAHLLPVNVAAMGEPVRSSPFMEEIVIHQRGTFDLAAEVDVFATHLQYQLRTARNHQLLIADKTIINVLAYARMLLDIAPDSIDAAVLDAMETDGSAGPPGATSGPAC